MQGNLNVDSLKKSAGNGHINSPVSGPIKNQTTTEQTNKKHNKNKNTKHREVGSLPALKIKMHDDILCVILRMATEKEAKQRRHETTQRGHARG